MKEGWNLGNPAWREQTLRLTVISEAQRILAEREEDHGEIEPGRQDWGGVVEHQVGITLDQTCPENNKINNSLKYMIYVGNKTLSPFYLVYLSK